MKFIVVDNGSRHIQSLKRLCTKYGEVRVYPLSDLASISDEPDTILILSGSHSASVVGHIELYQAELDLIRRTEMPIIGICLGFELIAVAYGLQLLRRKRRLHRITRVYLDSKSRLVMSFSSFLTYESHRWYVREVDAPLVEVASSRREVEVLRHSTKPIYATQFHPEVRLNRNKGFLVFGAIVEQLKSAALKS
jgi:GMP synthase-like glutamine amidotransferase